MRRPIHPCRSSPANVVVAVGDIQMLLGRTLIQTLLGAAWVESVRNAKQPPKPQASLLKLESEQSADPTLADVLAKLKKTESAVDKLHDTVDSLRFNLSNAESTVITTANNVTNVSQQLYTVR